MSKDAVSYILENSQSEEDYGKKIVDYAKEVHGQDKVSHLLDTSPDQETFIKNVSDLVKQPKETLESKYLEPVVYPAAKTALNVASAIGTLPQTLAAPYGYLANTASNLVQGKELETEPKIYEHPVDWIHKYGTTNALGRTIDTPNLSKSLGSLTEGWKSRDSDVATQFPKASQAVSDITPKQVLEGAGDIALLGRAGGAIGAIAESDAVANGLTNVSDRLSKASVPYVKKALIRFSDLSADDKVSMETSGKFDTMAMTLSEYGLSKHITDPAKLQKILTGETVVTRPDGLTEKLKKPGFIDTFAKDTSSEASSIDRSFSLGDIKANAMEKIDRKYGAPDSGVEYTPETRDAISKAMDGMIKIEQRGNNGIVKLPELLNFKRKMADYVFDLKSKMDTSSTVGVNEKAIREALWEATDNNISANLKYSEAGSPEHNFLKSNERLSDLLNVRNNLNNSIIDKISTPGLAENIAGAAVGSAAAAATGFDPLMGASVYPAVRYGARALETGIPAIIGSGMAKTAESIYSPIESGFPLQGSSMVKSGVVTGTAYGKMVNDYKLPRSYDEMKAESALVKDKLTMVMGAEKANMAIEHMLSSPQEFTQNMPLLENQMPGLFKYDKYRRIDGVIFDPILKQLAEKEITNAPISNTERMMMQFQLLKYGKYDGP